MAFGDLTKKFQDALANPVKTTDEMAAGAAGVSGEVGSPSLPLPSAPVAPAAPPVESQMGEALLQLAALLKEMRTANTGPQQKAMLDQADILQQLLIKTKPENVAPPMISVFSYPEGDRDRPRPALKCKMTWVGYELDPNTLTVAEIEALNRLEPGTMRVTKADSTKIEFRVSAVHDGNLRLERMDVWFPCKGEQRHNHGSMLSYCQQSIGAALPDVNDLIAELARTKAALMAVA